MSGDVAGTQRLDFGLEAISRWRANDEFHLPAEGKAAPMFQPRHRELEEILRRPSLDERLTDLLQPLHIAPELLEPGVMSQTREGTYQLLKAAAENTFGYESAVFKEAAALLENEVQLDQLVRSALAAFVKG